MSQLFELRVSAGCAPGDLAPGQCSRRPWTAGALAACSGSYVSRAHAGPSGREGIARAALCGHGSPPSVVKGFSQTKARAIIRQHVRLADGRNAAAEGFDHRYARTRPD